VSPFALDRFGFGRQALTRQLARLVLGVSTGLVAPAKDLCGPNQSSVSGHTEEQNGVEKR
jgi:hypothetical protein